MTGDGNPDVGRDRSSEVSQPPSAKRFRPDIAADSTLEGGGVGRTVHTSADRSSLWTARTPTVDRNTTRFSSSASMYRTSQPSFSAETFLTPNASVIPFCLFLLS